MIRILPLFDAFYYSFYIEGLRQTFGTENLRYDTQGKWPLVPHSLCFEVQGKKDQHWYSTPPQFMDVLVGN